jgi:branched-chain amino acid transport system substrate-binding protein
MQPSATFYTAKSAEILRKIGISTAAIIYVNNEFGVALRDSFLSDFESRGGKIVASEAYKQGENDFRTQLTKIKINNPEIVFIAGYQDTIDVIKQMKELGINAKVLAGPPFESKITIEKLGELAEGVLYPYHFVAGSNNPKAKQYEESYLKKYGIPTGGFAPLMYDGTYIIANALKTCYKENEKINTDCVKDQLYKTEYDGVIGKVTFDKNGDPIIPIVMKTVRNGQFVPYEE